MCVGGAGVVVHFHVKEGSEPCGGVCDGGGGHTCVCVSVCRGGEGLFSLHPY